MTPLQCYIAFALAAGVLTVTPGLDTALVLRTTVVDGRRRALETMLGIVAGCCVWGTVASIGLGALLAVSSIAYDAMRIAGAIYLCWLGLRMLARPRDAVFAMTDRGKGGGWFLRGLLTNLLNPKVGVFYVTFLPQFVPAGYPVVATSLAFTLIHAAEGALWLGALACAAGSLGSWLRRPAVVRSLDRLTGAVLVAFGLRLALERGR